MSLMSYSRTFEQTHSWNRDWKSGEWALQVLVSSSPQCTATGTHLQDQKLWHTQVLIKVIHPDFDLQSHLIYGVLYLRSGELSSIHLVRWEQSHSFFTASTTCSVMWILRIGFRNSTSKKKNKFRCTVGIWPYFKVLNVSSQCSDRDGEFWMAADSVCQASSSVWAPGWEHRRTTAP